jgi:hypothetical protein
MARSSQPMMMATGSRIFNAERQGIEPGLKMLRFIERVFLY